MSENLSLIMFQEILTRWVECVRHAESLKRKQKFGKGDAIELIAKEMNYSGSNLRNTWLRTGKFAEGQEEETLHKLVKVCLKLAPGSIEGKDIIKAFSYIGIAKENMPPELQEIVKKKSKVGSLDLAQQSTDQTMSNQVLDRIFPPLPHFFVERKQVEQEIIENITTSSEMIR